MSDTCSLTPCQLFFSRETTRENGLRLKINILHVSPFLLAVQSSESNRRIGFLIDNTALTQTECSFSEKSVYLLKRSFISVWKETFFSLPCKRKLLLSVLLRTCDEFIGICPSTHTHKSENRQTYYIVKNVVYLLLIRCVESTLSTIALCTQ